MNLKSSPRNNARTKSSNRWLQRQHSDIYTQQAKKDGYRSRAAYKLLELQQRDKLFVPGMTVIDLGAAPGGWSQVVKELIGSSHSPLRSQSTFQTSQNTHTLQGPESKLIALDLLPIETIPGVDIIQGDFQDDEVFNELIKRLDGKRVDLVISDMAPNISGITSIDQPRSMALADLALEFSQTVLKEGGSFLVKVFQGEGFQEYWSILKKQFRQVVIRKPKSSRAESREMYLLAKGFMGGQ